MAAIETLRPSHPRRSRWTWPKLRGFGANALLLLLALAMLLPIVWLFIQSILGNGSALRLPPVWLPTHPTLANYHQVFGFIPFLTFLWNSIKITAIVTVGAVTTSALAAYAFARLSFPFRNTLFVVLLCAIMVPNQVTAAPTYVLMHQLGLAQSQAAVWLPGLVSVFGIFLLRQFFQGIPRELEEAARLDGLSTLGILFKIVLPLSRHALAALAILIGAATWNDYFWPSIYLTDRSAMTLPVGLITLFGLYHQGSPVVIFAAISMTVVPLFLVFLLAQRAMTESLTMTGFK
jgi:multiple sugar transport system permease protein